MTPQPLDLETLTRLYEAATVATMTADIVRGVPGPVAEWYAALDAAIPALLTLARQAQAAQEENERLKAEVSSLRASAGEPTGAEPIGCPCPGACSSLAAQAEVTRLRSLVDEAAGVLPVVLDALESFGREANWGASALSGDTIRKINEAPALAASFLTRLRAQPNTAKPAIGREPEGEG